LMKNVDNLLLAPDLSLQRYQSVLQWVASFMCATSFT